MKTRPEIISDMRLGATVLLDYNVVLSEKFKKECELLVDIADEDNLWEKMVFCGKGRSNAPTGLPYLVEDALYSSYLLISKYKTHLINECLSNKMSDPRALYDFVYKQWKERSTEFTNFESDFYEDNKSQIVSLMVNALCPGTSVNLMELPTQKTDNTNDERVDVTTR